LESPHRHKQLLIISGFQDAFKSAPQNFLTGNDGYGQLFRPTRFIHFVADLFVSKSIERCNVGIKDGHLSSSVRRL
jgi:hypothetical protein